MSTRLARDVVLALLTDITIAVERIVPIGTNLRNIADEVQRRKIDDDTIDDRARLLTPTRVHGTIDADDDGREKQSFVFVDLR